MSKTKPELYKVDWTKMGQAPEIGERERDFLSYLESDDGTFLISEDGLDEVVADWKESRADREETRAGTEEDLFTVPVELVEFLRQQLAAEEGDFSVAVF